MGVFATTARARAKIAAILRKERKANQKIGEELLNEFLKKEEIRPEEAVIEKLRNFTTSRMKKSYWPLSAAKPLLWEKRTRTS
mgnify:CR=1 FL=1